jgi:cell fate (sporulation/competence/biofilm development) regulator YlbF (YheA/YmcA/DUF963 family)
MILEKARDLGLALSESQEFLRMQSARAVLDSNEAVTSTLQDYQQKQEQLLDLLSGDNRTGWGSGAFARCGNLQKQLQSNPVFRALEAQKCFFPTDGAGQSEISAAFGFNNPKRLRGSCTAAPGCH